MKFFGTLALTIVAGSASLANGQTVSVLGQNSLEYVGTGFCEASRGGDYHDFTESDGTWTIETCGAHCMDFTQGLRGVSVQDGSYCRCYYDDGYAPGGPEAGTLQDFCPSDRTCNSDSFSGSGEINSADNDDDLVQCWKFTSYPVNYAPTPTPSAAPTIKTPDLVYVGVGNCRVGGISPDFTRDRTPYDQDPLTKEQCNQFCFQYPQDLRGFSWAWGQCNCWYDAGLLPNPCPDDRTCFGIYTGSGEIDSSNNDSSFECYRYGTENPVPEATGDPHFRTWKDEHFEFHGQCDIVMTKIKDFANQAGVDLDIQLRTKIVRYWSYIQVVAIRIGHDILEVEGRHDFSRSYWINFEHNGELTELGGFPVTVNDNNDRYTIDLGSKFPGQKIEIKTFKEFVGVKIIGATDESFGTAVGIIGDFKTGKTLARDGTTVMHDFNDLGLEWQVLPSDGKLFHEMARPQFPELCYLPEDPRGQRTRRLDESAITEEAAEAACASLKDEFDRKGCIYDILATQDMDMVGAY